MKILLAAYLALLGTAPSAAATAKEALASRQFLIGTWNCTYTVAPTDGSAPTEEGPYTTTWSNTLDGAWLKQTYDQPAAPKSEPFKAEYFIGYDERKQKWIRFGVMTTGQYFAIRMTDDGDGGWKYRYVSLFPFPPSASSANPPDVVDATFSRKSDSEYTIEGPTYREGSNGPTVAEHHDCKKASAVSS
jgi:hypothetical protein